MAIPSTRTTLRHWLMMLLGSYLAYTVLWAAVELQYSELTIDPQEMGLDLLQCALFTMVVFAVNAIFRRLWRGRFARTVIEVTVMLFVNALIIFIIDKILLASTPEDGDFWSIIDIYIICIICSLMSIIDLQHSYHKEFTALRQEQMQLRLQLLQQQLSPHFMFNSLSTLKGVVAVDPHMAEEYLDHLSNVLRYVTENVGHDRVELFAAMDFIENYIKMLQVRFPHHFLFEIDDKNMPQEAYVVPVSMQIVVENAIKHNLHSTRQPLEISIKVKADAVEIRNKKQSVQYVEGIGVGLKNLDQRYKLLIGRGLAIHDGKECYAVEIPLIFGELRESLISSRQQDPKRPHNLITS